MRLARPTRTAGPETRPVRRLPPCGKQPDAPSLFGLAPGGACHAAPVAGGAVRSCRTLSPLPRPAPSTLPVRGGHDRRRGTRRSAFCGAFPEVRRRARNLARPASLAGCYPAPCFRGARTFLQSIHGAADATCEYSGGHPTGQPLSSRRLMPVHQACCTPPAPLPAPGLRPLHPPSAA